MTIQRLIVHIRYLFALLAAIHLALGQTAMAYQDTRPTELRSNPFSLYFAGPQSPPSETLVNFKFLGSEGIPNEGFVDRFHQASLKAANDFEYSMYTLRTTKVAELLASRIKILELFGGEARIRWRKEAINFHQYAQLSKVRLSEMEPINLRSSAQIPQQVKALYVENDMGVAHQRSFLEVSEYINQVENRRYFDDPTRRLAALKSLMPFAWQALMIEDCQKNIKSLIDQPYTEEVEGRIDRLYQETVKNWDSVGTGIKTAEGFDKRYRHIAHELRRKALEADLATGVDMILSFLPARNLLIEVQGEPFYKKFRGFFVEQGLDPKCTLDETHGGSATPRSEPEHEPLPHAPDSAARYYRASFEPEPIADADLPPGVLAMEKASQSDALGDLEHFLESVLLTKLEHNTNHLIKISTPRDFHDDKDVFLELAADKRLWDTMTSKVGFAYLAPYIDFEAGKALAVEALKSKQTDTKFWLSALFLSGLILTPITLGGAMAATASGATAVALWASRLGILAGTAMIVSTGAEYLINEYELKNIQDLFQSNYGHVTYSQLQNAIKLEDSTFWPAVACAFIFAGAGVKAISTLLTPLRSQKVALSRAQTAAFESGSDRVVLNAGQVEKLKLTRKLKPNRQQEQALIDGGYASFKTATIERLKAAGFITLNTKQAGVFMRGMQTLSNVMHRAKNTMMPNNLMAKAHQAKSEVERAFYLSTAKASEALNLTAAQSLKLASGLKNMWGIGPTVQTFAEFFHKMHINPNFALAYRRFLAIDVPITVLTEYGARKDNIEKEWMFMAMNVAAVFVFGAVIVTKTYAAPGETSFVEILYDRNRHPNLYRMGPPPGTTLAELADLTPTFRGIESWGSTWNRALSDLFDPKRMAAMFRDSAISQGMVNFVGETIAHSFNPEEEDYLARMQRVVTAALLTGTLQAVSSNIRGRLVYGTQKVLFREASKSANPTQNMAQAKEFMWGLDIRNNMLGTAIYSGVHAAWVTNQDGDLQPVEEILPSRQDIEDGNHYKLVQVSWPPGTLP